jgi:protoporphyrinogen oxidase
VSEPTRYRDGRGTDPPDRTVLCAEVPCARGDDRWEADDAALGATVAGTLAAQGLPDATPSEVEVRRVPHAYPIYDLGFEDRFDAVDGWTSAQPSLLTLGRQGLFAHDNTHHALAMANGAVDCLDTTGTFDHVKWQRYRKQFESHVVED